MNTRQNNKLRCAFIILFLHTFFASFMLQAQDFTLPVGALPGEINVSNIGAATYAIPIDVVPGTQGIQPNLSIMYNSFGGPGLLGMKWSLAGFSAITRTGKNPYFDGDITAIQFNAEDRFALDGERLLLQANGEYGIINVPYATESENFIRVIPRGGSQGKPAYFEVYTDDGTIIEYGNSTGVTGSKQIMGASNDILSWCISKITDAHGNYMTFEYEQSNNEIRLLRINYTMNAQVPAMTQPYAKVEFVYEEMPNEKWKNTFFLNGYCIRQTKLLKNIVVKYGTDLVRKYTFNYCQGNTERTPHLREIVLSDVDDTPLNATTIDWGEQNTDIETSQQDLQVGTVLTGDFIGDGYTDMVIYGMGGMGSSETAWKLFATDRTGQFIPMVNGTHEQQCRFYAYDLNMDGQDEMIMANPNRVDTDGNTYWDITSIRLSPYSVCYLGSAINFREAYFGKFSKNGVPDMLFLSGRTVNNQNTHYYALMDVNGNQLIDFYDQFNNAKIESDKIYVSDVNGSGRDNINVIVGNRTYTYEYQSGALTPVYSDGFPTKWHHIYPGDFNGDGIKDLLVYVDGNSGQKEWRLHIGKGDYTFTHSGQVISQLDATPNDHSATPYPPKYYVIIADINGDGKDEIIQAVSWNETVSPSILKTKTRLDFYFLNTISNDGTCTFNMLEQITYDKDYSYASSYRLGDFNGDGKVDILLKNTKYDNKPVIIYTNKKEQYELVKGITDGMGKKIELEYNPAYRQAISTNSKESIPYYFHIVQKYFLPVVEKLRISDGIGDLTTLQYEYADAAFSWSKRTFLGFKKFTCTNRTACKQEEQTFLFYSGRQTIVPEKQYTRIHIHDARYDVKFKKLFSMYNKSLPNNRYIPVEVEITSIDLNSDTKTVTTNTHNDQGRLIESNTKTYNEENAPVDSWLHSETSTFYYKGVTLSNEYHKKTVPDKVLTTQHYKTGQTVSPPINDMLTYTYDFKGRLIASRQENADGALETTYENYEEYKTGVYRKKTMFANTSMPRKEEYFYDATRRFITQTKNAIDHSLFTEYDPKTGNVESETNANDLTTSYTYNTFGNLTKIEHSDNTETHTQIAWCSSSAPPHAVYFNTTTTSGEPDVKIYFDILGREVCRESEPNVFSDTRYNAKGEVTQTSYPYNGFHTPDSEKIWCTYKYDNYGRKIEEEAPYTHLQYGYNNRKVTVTDLLRNNMQTWKNFDALDRITQAKDEGGMINYSYSFANNRHTTTISINEVLPGNHPMPANLPSTIIETDLWGNRLKITDPNAGTITSIYNGLNELVEQVDARNCSTTYQYDVLGRVTKKQFTDSHNTQPLTYSYSYYDNFTSVNKGRGKLHTIKMNHIDSEIFTYDAAGRLEAHEKIIDGDSYTFTYSYDVHGKLQNLTYPNGFDLTYNYLDGQLRNIKRSDTGHSIYKVDSRNIYHAPLQCQYNNLGAITTYTYNAYGLLSHIYAHDNVTVSQPGNGIGLEEAIIPGQGEIISGEDIIPGGGGITPGEGLIYEENKTILNYRYTYDNKGLMVGRSDSVMKRFEAFEYDNLDRLTKVILNDQTGTPQIYSYHDNGNITAHSGVGIYNYTDNEKVHAVTSIDPVDDSLFPADCEVVYNFFNQPIEITEGDCRLVLSYGANQQRNKVERYRNGTLENTRYYINKYYEKEIDHLTETVRHFTYIYGDNGVVALRIFDETARQDSMYRIHTDHLGSYMALTNSIGKVVQRNVFDVWGNPVPVYTPTDLLQEHPLNFVFADRGFTGHEHYPKLKIINMNGRLYDPVIGRFFSPDKYVANSSFTQDFNRYTYARNNPLMYTDPSGEFVWIPMLIGTVIAATTYTMQTAMLPGGLQQNWNLGQFVFNTVFGGVVGGFSAGIGTVLTPALTAAGIGGFASGAITGAVTGTFTGTVNGLVQYGMTRDPNAIWRAALMGMGTGALIGGISNGIQAKMEGKTFWNGDIKTTTTLVDQNITPVQQNGDMNCVPANIESISNGQYTQDDVRSQVLPDSDPNSDGMITYQTAKWYAEQRGTSFEHVNLTTNPLSAEQYANTMTQGNGNNAILSLGEGEETGHAVSLKSIVRKTIIRPNGKEISRTIYTLMDPAVGRFVKHYGGIYQSRAVYFIGIR